MNSKLRSLHKLLPSLLSKHGLKNGSIWEEDDILLCSPQRLSSVPLKRLWKEVTVICISVTFTRLHPGELLRRLLTAGLRALLRLIPCSFCLIDSKWNRSPLHIHSLRGTKIKFHQICKYYHLIPLSSFSQIFDQRYNNEQWNYGSDQLHSVQVFYKMRILACGGLWQWRHSPLLSAYGQAMGESNKKSKVVC